MIRHMDMAFIFTRMEQVIKEIGLKINNMVMVKKNGQTTQFMKENIAKA